MNTIDLRDFDGVDIADEEGLARSCAKGNRMRAQKRTVRKREDKGAQQHIDFFCQVEFDEMDESSAFEFFAGEGLISGPGTILKQGKEACVWKCPACEGKGRRDVAVKVYKNIEHRSFKAMAGYLQGRLFEAGINRRDSMHILSTPSELQGFWVYSEFTVMERLWRAGLPVPTPFAKNGTALAMEFIYGEDGEAAPRLRDAKLDGQEARAIKATLLESIETMLSLNVIHGDLSPYNVLVRNGKPVIIDFPQAIDARYNSLSAATLERDVLAICRFRPEVGIDPETEARGIAGRLWTAYSR